MRVLITGGAGFIGSHTVDFFLKNNLQVVVIDNLSTGFLSNLTVLHPNLVFINEDLLTTKQLGNVVATCDAVVHLAAVPSVPKSMADPIYTLQNNTQSFLQILQAIRQSNRSIRLIYASSAAVYGNRASLPCRDDDDAGLKVPSSPYALEKSNNERYAELYKNLFGISSLGLRYFNVYGERQDPASPYSGVITQFKKSIERGLPITIYGDGKQTRDFIHVQDVARANYLALMSQYSGYLNVATGVGECLNDLITYFGQTHQNIRYEPARPGDIQHSYALVERAQSYMGFKAEISLKEGIEGLKPLS